jgi:hypothetical protein
MNSRRNFLKTAGAAAVGGAALAGTASADTNQTFSLNGFKPRVDNGKVKGVGFDIRVPNTGADPGWGIKRIVTTVAYNTGGGEDSEKFVWRAFDRRNVSLGRYQTRYTQQKNHDASVLSFMMGRGLKNIRVRYIVTFVDNTNPNRTKKVKDVHVLRKGTDF